MKVTLESTTQIVRVDDRYPARVWEGFTDTGIPVIALIMRVAVPDDAPQEQFEAELKQCRPPRIEPRAFDMRFFTDDDQDGELG